MNPKPRFHWWTSLVLLAAGGLLALVFGGRRTGLPVVPRAPGDTNVLRVAYVQDLRPDPHEWTLPFPTYNHFVLSLWEPLVECDPATGQPQPAAAASWNLSADGLILTLKLRSDGRWSNGDRVTAGDFVRGWHRLLGRNMDVAQTLFFLKNAEAYNQGRIKDPQTVGVHAVDDQTLRVELAQARTNVVAELANPLLVPLHASTEGVLAEAAYYRAPTRLLTNGPFRLVAADADGYRMEPSEYFHGRDGIRLAGVQFVRTDNAWLARLMVAAGVIDLVSPALNPEDRPLPTHRPVFSKSELVLAVSSLDFNVTRGPLRDLRVRRALALALNRVETIRQFGQGRLVPAWSWVPGMPGREGLTLLHEDAAEARRLLADAGYPGGRGFPVLRMALTIQSKSDPFPPAWTESWFQQLGIRTHISYEPMDLRAHRLAAGDYDVLYGTLIATVPDAADMMSGFQWPLEYSNTKWLDQEMIALLTQADSQTGVERRAILEQAERRLMAAVPAVPVTFTRRQALLADDLRGWYEDPLGRQSIRRLWLARTPAVATPTESKL
jgi:oligopeptide transport system substrate-binding protein